MSENDFEGAKSKIIDPHSCFKLMRCKRHVTMPPRYMGRLKMGIKEQLNLDLNSYSERFLAVTMAYNNVRVMQPAADIHGDTGYLHFDIEADFVLFQPQIGSVVYGVANKLSHSHVGCLVHDVFNASVPRPGEQGAHWVGDSVEIGDKFQFEITHIFPHFHTLSLRGKFTDDPRIEKSEMFDVDLLSENLADAAADGEAEQHTNYIAVVDENIVISTDENMTELSSKSEIVISPKKKKKSITVHDGVTIPTNENVIESTYKPETGSTSTKKKHKSLKNDNFDVKSTTDVIADKNDVRNIGVDGDEQHHDQIVTENVDNLEDKLEVKSERKKKKKRKTLERKDDDLNIDSHNVGMAAPNICDTSNSVNRHEEIVEIISERKKKKRKTLESTNVVEDINMKNEHNIMCSDEEKTSVVILSEKKSRKKKDKLSELNMDVVNLDDSLKFDRPKLDDLMKTECGMNTDNMNPQFDAESESISESNRKNKRRKSKKVEMENQSLIELDRNIEIDTESETSSERKRKKRRTNLEIEMGDANSVDNTVRYDIEFPIDDSVDSDSRLVDVAENMLRNSPVKKHKHKKKIRKTLEYENEIVDLDNEMMIRKTLEYKNEMVDLDSEIIDSTNLDDLSNEPDFGNNVIDFDDVNALLNDSGVNESFVTEKRKSKKRKHRDMEIPQHKEVVIDEDSGTQNDCIIVNESQNKTDVKSTLSLNDFLLRSSQDSLFSDYGSTNRTSETSTGLDTSESPANNESVFSESLDSTNVDNSSNVEHTSSTMEVIENLISTERSVTDLNDALQPGRSSKTSSKSEQTLSQNSPNKTSQNSCNKPSKLSPISLNKTSKLLQNSPKNSKLSQNSPNKTSKISDPDDNFSSFETRLNDLSFLTQKSIPVTKSANTIQHKHKTPAKTVAIEVHKHNKDEENVAQITVQQNVPESNKHNYTSLKESRKRKRSEVQNVVCKIENTIESESVTTEEYEQPAKKHKKHHKSKVE